VKTCVEVSATVLANIRLNEKRCEKRRRGVTLSATELADYLVRKGRRFAKPTISSAALCAGDRTED